MIYEMRQYRCVPGRLPALLKRFETITLKIWEKHGIRQAGFFTTLIGESNQELTYFLAWESLAERETKWGAFAADPGLARGACQDGGRWPDRRQHRQPDSGSDGFLFGQVAVVPDRGLRRNPLIFEGQIFDGRGRMRLIRPNRPLWSRRNRDFAP